MTDVDDRFERALAIAEAAERRNGGRKRRVNTDPLRKVAKAIEMSGRGGLFMAGHMRIDMVWWELHLECGHHVERTARYPKGASEGRRGWARLHHPPTGVDVLPAPKRARCEYCGRDAPPHIGTGSSVIDRMLNDDIKAKIIRACFNDEAIVIAVDTEAPAADAIRAAVADGVPRPAIDSFVTFVTTDGRSVPAREVQT